MVRTVISGRKSGSLTKIVIEEEIRRLINKKKKFDEENESLAQLLCWEILRR